MEAIIAQDVIGNRGNYVTAKAVARTRLDDAAPMVFIIDGDLAVRQSLERLIRTAGWDPEAFASAEEFLSHPRGTVPCCVILDLTLPGLSGLALQQQLAGRPDMPIIFLSSHTDVPMVVQAMKAGAIEFLIKPFNDAALVYVIGAAIERSRAALRHHSDVQLLRDGYATLTQREREVMGLVVSGLLNKQVGGELGIHEATVKAHRGQVMRKMKADSLPDLVTMAVRLGLLPTAKH
jgi:FixJ family two-component response regulator